MEYGRCRFIGVWSDWELLLHANKAQIARQGWAMTYPFSFCVNASTKTARFSSTSDLPYYDTSLSACDCYDFQERKMPCKHIYRLAVELGIIEIFKRPSFNKEDIEIIKNSSDIDTHPAQVKRYERGMEFKKRQFAIDFENKTASFLGSGSTLYKVTIDSCTCRDFLTRDLPCKHIYRLRYEVSKQCQN